MKKSALLLIPVAILPYILILALATTIMSTDVPLFGWIMENVFKHNALILLLWVVVYAFIAFVLAAICIAVCLIKNTDSLSVARTAMTVKLIQIPAYVILFFLGLMFLMTIFTYAFTVVLAVLEYFLLVMTGLVNIAAVILAARQGKATLKGSFWTIFWQFFFCADVIASISFYLKLKRQREVFDD